MCVHTQACIGTQKSEDEMRLSFALSVHTYLEQCDAEDQVLACWSLYPSILNTRL